MGPLAELQRSCVIKHPKDYQTEKQDTAMTPDSPFLLLQVTFYSFKKEELQPVSPQAKHNRPFQTGRLRKGTALVIKMYSSKLQEHRGKSIEKRQKPVALKSASCRITMFCFVS